MSPSSIGWTRKKIVWKEIKPIFFAHVADGDRGREGEMLNMISSKWNEYLKEKCSLKN